MIRRISVVLVYCFVVFVIGVTGQRNAYKQHANTPPRTSHQPKQTQPRLSGSVSQRSRPTASIGQPSLFSGSFSQSSRSTSSVGQTPRRGSVGQPSRRGSGGQSSRSRCSVGQPPRQSGNVGQPPRQPPLGYEHDRRYYHQMNVNYNWQQNPNNGFESSHHHSRPDDSKRQYTNTPPLQYQKPRPNTSVNSDTRGGHTSHEMKKKNTSVGQQSRTASSVDQQSRSTGSVSQQSRSTGSIGQQPRQPSPSYDEYNRRYYQHDPNRHFASLNSMQVSDDIKRQYTTTPPMQLIEEPRPDTSVGQVSRTVDTVGQSSRSDGSDGQPYRPPQHSNEHDRRYKQQTDVNNNWQQNSNMDMHSGIKPLRNIGPDNPVKLQIINTPFKFGYDRRDIGSSLKMDIHFKLPSDVHTGFVLLRHCTKDLHPEDKFEIIRPNLSDESDDKVAHVEWKMSRDQVYFDVQLYNKTGVCLNTRIAEGRMLEENLKKSDLDYTYTVLCLNDNKCQLEVDLRKTCRGAEITEAVNHNLLIIIGSSLLGIALLVFFIVAIFKRCWIKCDAPDTIQRSNVLPYKPFYLNLLFRKECQEIIDDLEQNHYELID